MRIGAGRWKNAKLPAAGDDARPVPARLRTSLFSVLSDRVEGARVLDLCAGVGGLGLEALSRGAASVVLADADRRAVEAIRRWARERGVERQVAAVVADARRGGWPPGPYDLVFLDPPYALWEDSASARALLTRAGEALAGDGVLAVKSPSKGSLPTVPELLLLDRRGQGTVAWSLLRKSPSEGQGGGPPARLP
jgi:16S rRNA (guanine966-N2)-methyltransferase